MDKEGDDANCNYGQMEAIDLPEDVYPCDGWPDYSSYAHVRANKLHNGLFMIDGILFAFFKKVDKPQQLWTQTKEEKAQVFYWSKHINKTKLRDKPFFVKKKRRNARYFKWHLYCWDQRQGWQYIIDMGYYREDGNLATRRFPPTVVHIQERQKQDNRFRLLISQGEGSVRFVEIFDCEEQFEKQIEWDKINLRNQDLLHEIDVDISLEYGRDICSSSDAINLLLASPPVRAVYPIYLESAILDNDTGLVRCVFWSMAQDMSNGTTTYMAILRLAINECSWSEQYSLEILQIVKLTESSIQPYVVFDNPIQNTILVVKCLVQLNGQVQNQYGGSEKDNDCKQKDDDDVSEEAVEQENEQGTQIQQCNSLVGFRQTLVLVANKARQLHRYRHDEYHLGKFNATKQWLLVGLLKQTGLIPIPGSTLRAQFSEQLLVLERLCFILVAIIETRKGQRSLES
eukprot:TRINITY_DN2457_c0_g1_i2.p1 TRINITY_DN2457_c0_g1~~TRINITY_DN2457_c0_g1_i2.p1  ORF type:complete len:457 (-),score=23.54 TRINITY_DN2457_c0_g1_i2:351-1721(-)